PLFPYTTLFRSSWSPRSGTCRACTLARCRRRFLDAVAVRLMGLGLVGRLWFGTPAFLTGPVLDTGDVHLMPVTRLVTQRLAIADERHPPVVLRGQGRQVGEHVGHEDVDGHTTVAGERDAVQMLRLLHGTGDIVRPHMADAEVDLVSEQRSEP